MANQIHVGQWDSKITVVSSGEEAAITRWNAYHQSCNLWEITEDPFEKLLLGAALDDEYAEIISDDYLMGIGLVAYNDYLRNAG